MILLGYRDRNVHELVCHEVARRAGYYERMGVEVEAVPGADHPDAAFSAGLGGSLVEALRGQRRWKAALAHTLHPLFWIWTRKTHGEISSSTILAGHPEGSIVSAFTRKSLSARDVGDAELSVLRFPVGSVGDHQRLEALASGAVDAAVLVTTFAPSALTRLGSRSRCSSVRFSDSPLPGWPSTLTGSTSAILLCELSSRHRRQRSGTSSVEIQWQSTRSRPCSRRAAGKMRCGCCGTTSRPSMAPSIAISEPQERMRSAG